MKKQQNSSPLWIKIKNLEIKKRYVFLLVIVALCFRFWGESSITVLQRKVPVVTSTDITLGEIYSYIQTKQQYLAENISISPDLINNKDLEKLLKKDIHEWFLVRNWRPTRFFYVEKRIKLIVSCIQKQDAQLEKADKLDAQAQYLIKTTGHFSDPSLNQSSKAAQLFKEASDLRFYIKKEIRKQGVSIMEEKNIRNNLNSIIPLIDK